MKVAIVQDWILQNDSTLTRMEALLEIFPRAEVFTLSADKRKLTAQIHPHVSRLHETSEAELWHDWEKLIRETQRFGFDRFDIVFSNSSGPTRWIKKQKWRRGYKNAFHIAFVEEALPFLWNKDFFSNDEHMRLNDRELSRFRREDYEYFKGVDLPLTTDKVTSAKLFQIYGSDFTLITPPIHPGIQPHQKDLRYFFVQIAYPGNSVLKKVIDTFSYLKTKIVISAPPGTRGISSAKNHKNILNVIDLGGPEQNVYLDHSYAIISPSLAGSIVPVQEALYKGVPVLACPGSPAISLIQKNEGIILENEDRDALFRAVYEFRERSFDREKIRETHASLYGKKTFVQNLRSILEQNLPKELLPALREH